MGAVICCRDSQASFSLLVLGIDIFACPGLHHHILDRHLGTALLCHSFVEHIVEWLHMVPACVTPFMCTEGYLPRASWHLALNAVLVSLFVFSAGLFGCLCSLSSALTPSSPRSLAMGFLEIFPFQLASLS